MVLVLLQSKGRRGSTLLARQEANEAKPTGAVGGRINHDHRVRHGSKCLEVLSQLSCSSVLRQAPDEELVRARHSPLDVHLSAPNLVRIVQSRLGTLHLGERDVAKATRAPIRPAQNNSIHNPAVLHEVVPEVLRCRLVRETTYEDLPGMALVLLRGTIRGGTAPLSAAVLTPRILCSGCRELRLAFRDTLNVGCDFARADG
mmetsp:Transcript_32757/g.76538  ORF Transcript_32757/g.76538 Transcript_32757/m.76538 type:complete len:202 (+) Transcript_32757:881-1486(+)